MYTEEMKEQEGNTSKEVGSANTKDKSQPHDPSGHGLDHHHQMKGLQSYNPDHQSFNNQTNNAPTDISNYLSGFPIGSSSHHHHSHDMQIRSSPKKPRSSTEVMNNSPSSILSVDMEMKPGGGDHIGRSSEGNAKLFGMETHSLISGNNGNDNSSGGGGGGFGGFTMEDMGRYNVADHQLAPRFHGNGVSLTLGLPHTTDSNLPRHGFLSHNINLTSEGSDFCAMNAPPPSHSNASYENIDHIQNRKRFAAQLLPDFVA